MKKIEDIEKSIKTCDWFIKSHKEQIQFYLDGDFDIDKIEDYSNKIKLLEVEKSALQWVLGGNEK